MTSTARTAAPPPPVPAELLPRTVAVAMDGNGRWARARGLSRSEGHRAGAERLPELARAALEIGVRRLVVYGFSTENWRRSPQEVAALMRLSEQALGAQRERLHAMGVRVRWSGRPGRLWRGVVRELRATEELTRDNDRLTLDLCVNYGGQAELVDAMAAIARQAGAGVLRPEAVDEELLGRHLYQADGADVELFLRPSGEHRTSNFLLWQLAHAELVFLDVLWPDFERRHLWEAVRIYAERRRRREGGVPDLSSLPRSSTS